MSSKRIKDLVKKYKNRYQVKTREVFGGRETYMVYVGKAENYEEKKFISMMLNNMTPKERLSELSSSFGNLYGDPYTNKTGEQIFLSFLLYSNQIEESEIKEFREEMFRKRPGQKVTIGDVLTAIGAIGIIVLIIVGLSMG